MVVNHGKHENHSEGPAYYTLRGAKVSADNAKLSGMALQEYNGFSSQASHREDYRSLDGPNSGRPGLTPADYYAFRPGEAPPNSFKELFYECNRAYRKVGIIRNIIDLMGDFASQGIRLVCKSKKEQKIYDKWFKAVSGQERSERFMNNFYRTGNVIVRKITGKTTIKVKRMLAKGEADMQIPTDTERSVEIPWKYVFLDPTIVTAVGGELAGFVGKPTYAITLSNKLRTLISSPKSDAEKQIVKALPADILAAAKSGKPYPLPPEKTDVFFYKKDDWEMWGTPLLEAILPDIKSLIKLKLADQAALDGAISNIRLFKLGNLEHNIAPTPQAARRLAQILQSNVGGGTFDIIWGPDIELVESKTTVHQFLGREKYLPTLELIFMGLGIPPTIVGTFGAAGTTNNFMSLKTLFDRLEYGRDVLKGFWEKEIEQVQKVLGLKNKAIVQFDLLLADEAAEKKFWLDLYNLGLASDEMIRHIFKADNELEDFRLLREEKERESGKRLPKAGNYYDPQFELALKKIALQAGYIGPEAAGIKVEETKEVSPMQQQFENELKKAKEGKLNKGLTTTKKKGKPGQGRPINSKDKEKRKKKKFTLRTRSSLEIWANTLQKAISDHLNNFILELFGRANFRQLSEKEVEQTEKIKFGVLFNIAPYTEVNEQSVIAALKLSLDNNIWTKYQELITSVKAELNRPLTLDEERKLQIITYINYKE